MGPLSTSRFGKCYFHVLKYTVIKENQVRIWTNLEYDLLISE